jgi:L-phenylalanine/L-methionine N-acetyltransferase
VNIEYRRATANDAEGMAKLFSDPDVIAGTLQLPMPSADYWRKRLEPQATDQSQIHIVAIAEGVLIGSAGLHPVSGSLRTRHVMGLGIGVSRAWWGKGIGTELMRRLFDWADNWAGILRIELGVYSDNERAIGLYERFGFVREGVQRAFALRDGQYVDSVMMARLHPNPPALPRS